MNEDYCSYELAIKLKACGFDEPCIAEWACEPDGKPILLSSTIFVIRNAELKGRDVTAPLLYQAQKWLREIKGIAINVIAHDGGKYEYDIVFLPNAIETDNIPDRSPWCRTYEEALSEGIDSALELIEQENK